MIPVLVGGMVALLVGIVGTRAYTALAKRKGWAQYVRADGPVSHHSKRGTPQMGGIAIFASTLVGYAAAHLATWSPPTVSGLLVLFLMLGLGFIGFLDDWTKIRRERSLGLRSGQKLLGQTLVAIVFGVLATQFARDGITPASHRISVVRDTAIDLGVLGAVAVTALLIVWIVLMITACAMVLAAYTLIGIWQALKSCASAVAPGCYAVRDPLDLAVVAACLGAACIGFLWWNTPPAALFMGDTGSLGLGGALAGLAILSRTELLLIVLGGLFVFETVTVILQVSVFKATKRRGGGVGKRLFLITPIHHHFEQLGWSQVTVSVRFWIISAVCVAAGLGLFYGEWVLLDS